LDADEVAAVEAAEQAMNSGCPSSSDATGGEAPLASHQGNSAILPSVKEIALLLARFACNNHTICDEELRPVSA